MALVSVRMLPLPALVKPPVPERRPEKLVLVLPTSVSVAPRMMLPLPAIDATLSVPVRFQVAPLATLTPVLERLLLPVVSVPALTVVLPV